MIVPQVGEEVVTLAIRIDDKQIEVRELCLLYFTELVIKRELTDDNFFQDLLRQDRVVKISVEGNARPPWSCKMLHYQADFVKSNVGKQYWDEKATFTIVREKR